MMHLFLPRSLTRFHSPDLADMRRALLEDDPRGNTGKGAADRAEFDWPWVRTGSRARP
ncbi:hypothetical protein AB9K41_09185 [Cribrihabitans sp. XS_ASV171]